MVNKRTLLLIDGSNLMWRCLLGGQPLNRPSDGYEVHAAISFAQTLASLLKDFSPTHGLIAFDGPGPSFRSLVSEKYKGGREPREQTPDDVRQVGWIIHLARACGVAVVKSAPYEADDVLATAATRWPGPVVIAGDDKDLQALVSNRVRVRTLRDGAILGPKEVEARRGVLPRSLSDLLAVAGDGVDGHAGVRDVGHVTASKLLEEHGCVEYIVLAGPAVRGAPWRKLQEAAPRMIGMASITRLICDAVGSFEPSAIRPDWKLVVASFLLALEAPATLARFCKSYEVAARVKPDTHVATPSRRPTL